MLVALMMSTVLLSAPHAVDAETLRAGGETYRLANIDAPEKGVRADCGAERDLARKSTARVRALLAAARRVEARPTGRRDKYGRVVAHILVDGRDLGGLLMREKLAQPWRGRKAWWCDGAAIS